MEIQIKGTIIPNDDKDIYEFFGYESTCPNDVVNALENAENDKIDIYINSGGGDIFSATEIYSAIQKHKDNVKIHVVGLAASAASVIMCAAENDISTTSRSFFTYEVLQTPLPLKQAEINRKEAAA